MRFECINCNRLVNIKDVIIKSELCGMTYAILFYCKDCYKKEKGEQNKR